MKNTIAKIISAIFALPVTIFLIIYGIYISSSSLGGEQFWIISLQLLSLEIIFPFGIFAVLYMRGMIKDIDIINKRERILPFIIAIIFFSVSVLISMRTGNQLLFHYQLILLILLFVSFAITLFWKISLHAGVVTIAYVLLLTFSGFQYVYLGVIIPLVYWSRLYLKRHTHGQLIAGIVVNASIVVLMLYYFGYLSKPFFVKTTYRDRVMQTTNSPSATTSNSYETKVVARGLEIPWTLLFTSPNRLLVTERGGNVRQITNGELQEKPIHVFTEVLHTGEAGLLGMTKDKDYEANKMLYFCMSYRRNSKMANKIVVAQDNGDRLEDAKTLIDDLPSAQYHAGCRIAFGPDDKLYVTTGDITEKGLAQDPKSLAGKILRYNADGTIPTDSLIAGSPIYSSGHRNVQGIAWDNSGQLYVTEHGPSGIDGPGGGDEINKIDKGGNYGWPIVHHNDRDSRFVNPLLVMTPAEAPASAMFYSGRIFPQWQESFFYGTLKGEGLMRATIKDGSVTSIEKMFHAEFGRIRDVVESPTGEIYFTTSNRDGRGSVKEGDDKIIKIVPGSS